jgi:hypothetical protein
MALDELQEFLEEINLLSSCSKNWDGNGSEKPRLDSIRNAIVWGREIYSVMIENGYEWRKPLITADEEGNVVLEWWYKDRNLTLDITGSDIDFSETRDADDSPQITVGRLTKHNLPARLKWLALGINKCNQ